jgi:GT2 family glycosyltransferase
MPRSERTLSVCVVVAVRGNAPALYGLLQRIREQRFSGRLRLVVVDNHPRAVGVDELVGSSDVVVHEPRAGVSRARNKGVAQVDQQADYVIFTDPDSRPDPDWIRVLVGELERTGAYCAGGRLVPRYIGFATPPSLDPELEQLFVPLSWPEKTTSVRPPYWLAGCNLAVRRWPEPVFNERLGVRGRRRLACEDLELVERVRAEGREALVVPDAVVRRAIHARDLRLSALIRRAFGHGVSMARLQQRHPHAEVYDTARVRQVLAAGTSWRARVVHLARIAGWRSAALFHRGPAPTAACVEAEAVSSA